jgi:hypothetical protein
VYLRPVPRVALALTIVFFALVVERAVAQNATRDQALAEAVHIEPKDDRCLSEAVVRARVAKRLARNAELSNVQVVVHAEEPPRLTVLRAGQVVAERRFEDFPARCNARRDAIAVAVALALERAPETAPSAPSTTEPTPSTTEPAASTPSPAPSATSPSPSATIQPATSASDTEQDTPDDDTSSDSALKLGAHAGALAVLQILPGLAFAGVLGVDIGLPLAGLRVSLSAVASLPQEDDALGATVQSQLLLGRLLGCTDLSASELALEGCGGLLAGAVFAEGLGYASTRGTELGYAAVLARVALRYPAGGAISARIALDGLLPIVRPSYAVREQPGPGLAALTPAPIGAALSLEVVLALP